MSGWLAPCSLCMQGAREYTDWHAWGVRARRRCGSSEFSPGGQLFFTPLVQALRTMLHLGETVPEGYAGSAYHISAGSLALWVVVVFPLMLLSIGIGAASGTAPPSTRTTLARRPALGADTQFCLLSRRPHAW